MPIGYRELAMDAEISAFSPFSSLETMGIGTDRQAAGLQQMSPNTVTMET
jgi:hypothetical protein